ncbi:MAG: glycyl-radical enzyme activating protein [Clostridiales bacterium]|nr:glycyl-radical enzyme activating protein [Clostridiales bacterium]
MQGIITNIQRLSLHDGPGLRTAVFLKGCPLRCRWCHNPETQLSRPQPLVYTDKCLGCGACASVCPQGCHRMEGVRFDSTACTLCLQCVKVCPAGAIELCGEMWEPDRLAETLVRDKPFFGDEGGVTLSGGEPTMQAAFALELMDEVKKRGAGVAMETCGAFAPALLSELLSRVDHFLWDVKDTDPVRHQKNTGYPLGPILENLRRACSEGADVCVRGIILEGVNAEEAHARKLGMLARSVGARDCKLLSFHPYYSAKLSRIGRPGETMGQEYIPSDDTMKQLEQVMRDAFEG